jgi:ribosome-associated protein
LAIPATGYPVVKTTEQLRSSAICGVDEYIMISSYTARSSFPESVMRNVEITKQPVELFKILKFEGMVTTGGEAKQAIANGQVSVNGEIETRKRRKIVDGDVITFANESLQIRLA